MAVRQYIGARYVPEFANPLEWNKESTYEPLTIVYNAGNSYTSRQAVPAGIDITNNDYWALTGNYNAQIEQYRKEVQAYDQRITENTNEIAENATAISKNESDIADIEADGWVTTDRIADEAVTESKLSSDFVNKVQSLNYMNGIKTAKFIVFSDDSAQSASSEETVWTYFKEILNNENISMDVHTAAVNTGWVNTGADGKTAKDFINGIAASQSDDEKNSYNYVILNFGWYDIKNNASGSYETAGREVVNTASNAYPNAIIVVNPVSKNYCFNYNRTAQLNMYQFNYGATRSQVPVRIVPWYVALNINQMGTNHYIEGSNPDTFNDGGVESIGAIIKLALFGNELGYLRNTRMNLSNFITTGFTAADAEFTFNPLTGTVALTSGYLTATEQITSETLVGHMTEGTFAVSQDTILAICIQNTETSPLKGFLVLKADETIYFRLNEGASVNNGVILRMLPCGNYHPAFANLS